MNISTCTWRSVVESLVKKRKKLNLSQEVLAARMGYHVNTLRGWETYKVVPSALAFLSWTDSLNVTVHVDL
jgi:transcriptional regulator with XRE-family HTH domain